MSNLSNILPLQKKKSEVFSPIKFITVSLSSTFIVSLVYTSADIYEELNNLN